MGITGLLPFLKSIQKDVHVSALKGMVVGVDAYCWLHKGSYSCATQIVMKTAEVESLPLINYCLRRLNLLRSNDITPIVVFDGGYLPTKAHTEKERRQKRQSYLAKGKELLKEGKKSAAHECFQKCVDISPEIALALIKECRKLGIQCIVAPYEADAQLAYLSKEGIVDVVITEDSDLLVFGSKRVFFKMDESGNGKLIELKDLGRANKNLIGFTPDSFRQTCIFSGCDYLPSVPGIGLGKATKLMRKHNQKPTQVIRALRCENSNVPTDYEVNFKKAEYTFLYQLVFDPRSQQQVRLNPLPEGVEPSEFEFAGIEHSPRKAVNMARGNINPITQEVMDFYSPSKAPPPPPSKSSSWSGSAMGSAGKQYPVAIQAKLPISSSRSSRQAFKPPSKTRAKMTASAAADEVLNDDELMTMYSSSTPDGPVDMPLSSSPLDTVKSNKQKPNFSEFFSSEAANETGLTPTDCPSNDHVRPFFRRLEMDTAGNASTTSDTNDSRDTGDTRVMIGLKGQPKKRLFESAVQKLSRFANTKAKRHRGSNSALNATFPSLEHKPAGSNPFSLASQSLPGHVSEVDSSMELSQNRSSLGSPDVDYTDEAGSGSEEVGLSATTPAASAAETSAHFRVRSSNDMVDEGLCSIAETPSRVTSSHASCSMDGEASSSYSERDDVTGTPPPPGHCNGETSESYLVVDEEATPPSGSHRTWSSKSFSSVPNSSKKLSFGKQSGKSSCKRVGLPKRNKSSQQQLSIPDPKQMRLGAYAFAKKPQMKI